MVTELSRLSKAASHALRHEPWVYELELDEEGWASVNNLLVALRQEHLEWADLSEADLVHMIEASSKHRHEIKAGRIRALYGHSLAGKLKKTPARPPDVLYHGTKPEVTTRIKASGILPMGRQYVHLSVDEATAGSGTTQNAPADHPSHQGGRSARPGDPLLRGQRQGLAGRRCAPGVCHPRLMTMPPRLLLIVCIAHTPLVF